MSNVVHVMLLILGVLLSGGLKQSDEVRLYRQRELAAGGADAFEVPCAPDEVIDLQLTGEGQSQFQIFVYDQFGVAVAQTDLASQDCHLQWIAMPDAEYTVSVISTGDGGGTYTAVVR